MPPLSAHQKSHDPPPYSTAPPPSGRNNNERSLNQLDACGEQERETQLQNQDMRIMQSQKTTGI